MNHRVNRDESGLALVTVLGLVLLASILVTGATNYALRTLPRVQDHEAWNAALAAAEAGIEEVQARLNLDPRFYVDDDDNPARTGWRPLPGSASGASYHYRLDTSVVARTGAIDVVSTGRVGDQKRTIEARLRRDGFLDYIYFTDFETSDPFALTTSATARTALDSHCARYHHGGRPEGNVNVGNPTAGGCGTIQFAPGDTTHGPLRTNDIPLIRSQSGGPNFLGRVEVAATGDDRWTDTNRPSATHLYRSVSGSSGNPNFRDGIHYVPNMEMPKTGESLEERALETGCRYVGPTYIRFYVQGGSPRMTVNSPLTPAGTAGTGCGPGNGLALKEGEVLYVANATGTAPDAHPLGMNPPPARTISQTDTERVVEQQMPRYSTTAGDAFVHGRLRGQMTVAAKNDVVVVHDLTYDGGHSLDGTDLLGLIADNNVAVYHPVLRTVTERRQVGERRCTLEFWGFCLRWENTHTPWEVDSTGSGGTNVAGIASTLPPFNSVPVAHRDNSLGTSAKTWTDPKIDAAILALKRSFGVQQYDAGAPLGRLHVFGAIAQKWRGPVGTGGATISTGYLKEYVYDWRLRNLSPPHFLAPEQSPWGRRIWTEAGNPPVCAASEAPPTVACLPR